MAHIYYADKKFLRSNYKKTRKKTASGKSESFRTKKADQSWGTTMGPVYKIFAWIHRYHIYSPFRFVPFSILNGFGHLVGKFAFGSSKSVQRKMRASFNALFPGISEKRLHKLVDAGNKFMAMLFLDIAFRFPLTGDLHFDRHYSLQHSERLEEAFKKGKGVIIPILHIGQFLHSPNILIQIPNLNKKIALVVSVSNLLMYETANRASFSNAYAFASTKFSKIAPKIESILKENNAFVVYHDYSTKSQLRVPFIHGKFPYLIHTPQSYISLHKRTGAEILPAISHPDGVFGKTRLEFIDNKSIMDISKKYWESSKEDFHGHLSTEINKIMYPYIRKYAHLWEEIMRMPNYRCGDKIEFPKNCTIHKFLEEIQQKMLEVLENSFEPDRPDDQLIILIRDYFQPIINSLQNHDNILRPHTTFIGLSLMSGISELLKLCSVAQKELNLKGELQSSKLVQGFISKIKHYQNF